MELYIAAAIGRAGTLLSAFDHALTLTGVANRNLVRLSSVIPPGSQVVRTEQIPATLGGEWGDRLYVVYAEQRAAEPGTEVWAGVGWITDPRTGKGLFVEHEGDSEQVVREQISTSLDDLRRHRDGDEFGAPEVHVVGAACTGQPTCALVICAYAAEPWPRWRAERQPISSRRTSLPLALRGSSSTNSTLLGHL
jgi:arginine decarboxylase